MFFKKKEDFAKIQPNKPISVEDILKDKKPELKPTEKTQKPLPKEVKVLIVFLTVILLLVILLIVVKYEFAITSVKITGNSHYSEREIENLVMNGKYGHNSVYLYFKYFDKTVRNIPFIEQMDIELESPNSIRIQVYEKAIAGYVEYLGHYLYFDKDGIVVESSTEQMEGIPFVTGLSFDHIILHKELPVENRDIFKLILNITQLLTKYSISTDKIYFDPSENITLYFGDSKVYLGTKDYIDEKINRLSYLLPEMEGLSGTLYMDNYRGEGGKFTFEKEKNRFENTDAEEENSDESEGEEMPKESEKTEN